MKKEYSQMEIDTRSALEVATDVVVVGAIDEVLSAIDKNCEASNDNIMPREIRNRYEAYGVAAEQLDEINSSVKKIKEAVSGLLSMLGNNNLSAVDAAGNVYEAIGAAAALLVKSAAITKRVTNHLYNAETNQLTEATPLESWADDEYQETYDTEE